MKFIQFYRVFYVFLLRRFQLVHFDLLLDVVLRVLEEKGFLSGREGRNRIGVGGGQNDSVRKIAEIWNVPRSAGCRQLDGLLYKRQSVTRRRRLSPVTRILLQMLLLLLLLLLTRIVCRLLLAQRRRQKCVIC